MIQEHVPMNTAKAPEILIFQIRAVRVFINLDGNLVDSFLDIWGDVKLRWFHRALTVTDSLSINPYVESTHDALETEECLTFLPSVRQGECPFVLSGRITLLIGCPFLLGLSHDIGRVNLERITGRDIDGGAVAIDFPVGRNSKRFPS